MHQPPVQLAAVGLLLTQLGCTGFIASDEGGRSSLAGSAGSPASGGSGGVGQAPADAPEQDLSTLTCQTRYAPTGRVQRLTPEQLRATWSQAYQHAVAPEQLPKDGINQLTGFNNDASSSYVTVQLADAVFDAGEDIATQLTPAELASRTCLASSPDDACLDAFLGAHALRALRRPLETSEVLRYRDFFRVQAQAYDAAAAVRMTLQALLSSPGFVYRTELGSGEKGDVALTNYELVSQLSYSLADEPPSAALLAEAMQESALGAATVRGMAETLLQSAGVKAKAAQFFQQYLQLGSLELGGVEPDVADAMLAENAAFTQHVLWSSTSTLTELLTAPYTFVDQRLAPLYGLTSASPALERVELDPSQRAGVFTQLGFLASRHGPIHRGRAIREGLLCGTIPAPPPGASAQLERLAGPDPDATEQERWATFRTDAACGACHATFQPLGVAFDHYDELGRFRQVNHAGRIIDTRGSFVAAGELEGEFDDATAMIEQIVASTSGRNCFAKRYMSFAHGREVNTSTDACALKNVADRFVAKQLSVTELMVAFTQDESFYRRNNVE